MELTEKTIDSREVFKGRIIRVRFDTVRLPNGKEGTREVVSTPAAWRSSPSTARTAYCWCASTAIPSSVS